MHPHRTWHRSICRLPARPQFCGRHLLLDYHCLWHRTWTARLLLRRAEAAEEALNDKLDYNIQLYEKLLNSFDIIKELGSGSFGNVYLAEDTTNNSFKPKNEKYDIDFNNIKILKDKKIWKLFEKSNNYNENLINLNYFLDGKDLYEGKG